IFSLALTLLPTPPMSILFPYTTLFRSVREGHEWCFDLGHVACPASAHVGQRQRRGELDFFHGKARGHVQQLGAGNQALVDLVVRSEEHTSELQSRFDLVCRLLLENKII